MENQCVYEGKALLTGQMGYGGEGDTSFHGSRGVASKCTLARETVCHLPFLGKGLKEDFQTSCKDEHGTLRKRVDEN